MQRLVWLVVIAVLVVLSEDLLESIDDVFILKHDREITIGQSPIRIRFTVRFQIRREHVRSEGHITITPISSAEPNLVIVDDPELLMRIRVRVTLGHSHCDSVIVERLVTIERRRFVAWIVDVVTDKQSERVVAEKIVEILQLLTERVIGHLVDVETERGLGRVHGREENLVCIVWCSDDDNLIRFHVVRGVLSDVHVRVMTRRRNNNRVDFLVVDDREIAR